MTIQEARGLLGEKAVAMSDEEVEALINLLRGIAKIFVANYRKETMAQDASS